MHSERVKIVQLGFITLHTFPAIGQLVGTNGHILIAHIVQHLQIEVHRAVASVHRFADYGLFCGGSERLLVGSALEHGVNRPLVDIDIAQILIRSLQDGQIKCHHAVTTCLCMSIHRLADGFAGCGNKGLNINTRKMVMHRPSVGERVGTNGLIVGHIIGRIERQVEAVIDRVAARKHGAERVVIDTALCQHAQSRVLGPPITIGTEFHGLSRHGRCFGQLSIEEIVNVAIGIIARWRNDGIVGIRQHLFFGVVGATTPCVWKLADGASLDNGVVGFAPQVQHIHIVAAVVVGDRHFHAVLRRRSNGGGKESDSFLHLFVAIGYGNNGSRGRIDRNGLTGERVAPQAGGRRVL